MPTLVKWIAGGIVAVALGFGLLAGVLLQTMGAAVAGQTGTCQQQTTTGNTSLAVAALTPVASPVARASATATTQAAQTGEATCYPDSPYGSQVVQWARKMADALYVNPACGTRRGGNCNATWYTSAFPQPVIAYGQHWCQTHGGCADWANGSYQCVSFVRGAYSQVYPMQLTNNAFDLWATYQRLPGWQEIPALATPDITQRSLPQPGDIMVFHDLGVGHVAIVMAVQAPNGQTNGWISFANANSSSAYDRMPLLPNLLVDTSEWAASGGNYSVWGYIRPRLAVAQRVERVNQLDAAQYASAQEYATWAYSACSTAAMTEVLNAYGLHLRIHDVLVVESRLGEITPSGGLQEDVGIAHTLATFGFHTTWGENWSLAQLISTARSGTPVIVSWPPSRYDGGHLVVVTGGDSTSITLADSSSWNRHTLSVTQFQQWWAGFAAVATPNA